MGKPRQRRILVTTSRRPSPRVRSLVKDLAGTIPGAFKFTRGHYSMEELAREVILAGGDRIVVVGERRGNPGIIRVYDVRGDLSTRNIVSFIVKGVALSRELRRPLPSKADVLVVDAEPGIAEEFAEAFMIAFHAKLMEGRDPVMARIRGVNERTVLVEFEWRERLVGPRLKLGKPSSMIKVSSGESEGKAMSR